MSFSADQIRALQAQLNIKHVKSRTQGGNSLSYIEGWHAIDEANRIFGFGEWSRETIELKCVSEKPREIGAGKQPGHGVTYIARVRITVGDVVRDGCGTGHGIDRDLGQAHESALKEAETDAMKRALMTFGYPFGLALYDKKQTHVDRARPRASPNVMMSTPAPVSAPAADLPSPEVVADQGEGSEADLTMDEADALLAESASLGMAALKETWARLSPAHQKTLKVALDRRHKVRAEEADAEIGVTP